MTDSQQVARPRPVVLCILDGWGYRPETEKNAIALGHTPNWDRWMLDAPNALVETSGRDVGLPTDQMGNSEVGHTNIGAGRVVIQNLPRIDNAVANGSLQQNEALHSFLSNLRVSNGVCHLMGLVSPGGVHSHQDHLVALTRIVAEAGVRVRLHAFLDGRDSPPKSAENFMAKLIADISNYSGASVATVTGRYYAMDRDRRWDRTSKAYNVLTSGKGEKAQDPIATISNAYKNHITDEFILPTAIGDYNGMADGDGILMGNFRADRTRQILSALLDSEFNGFKRANTIRFSSTLGLVEYSARHNKLMSTIFASHNPTNILGQTISEAGLTQLRIAETEKYAHITFFLNGGIETAFPGESRILVPSPKVDTYDLMPEMSAPEVTDELVAAIEGRHFDVIIVNYANGDMVGHTGILSAAIKAVETIDQCLGRLERAITSAGGTLLISADHGNCELMEDPSNGSPHTAHTVGQVPVLLINPPWERISIHDGRLADLAPTVLDLLGLRPPKEMTGKSLINKPTRHTYSDKEIS